MRGLSLVLLLTSGCVGFYAEVGAGMAALDGAGSAATPARPGVNATYMFSVGLDSDFAHVSSVSMGIGSQTVQLGDSGSVQETVNDYRLAGTLRELSTDKRVVRFGAGASMVLDGQATLGSRKFSVFDVYVGPGVTLWGRNTAALTAFVTPRFLYLEERDASYSGWGAQARLRYTWLFGDSHFRGRRMLGDR